MFNDYHFITRWRVEGTVAEVHAILSDPVQLVRWWPAVYLDVKQTHPGDAQGIGRQFSLYTKGWLPYTLRWDLTATQSSASGFSLSARGDFVGQGVWTFTQDGPFVDLVYDWRVVADKPLLRALSFALKPIFAQNHEWAMRMGEQSLRLELARRRARTAEERDAVAPPPGPTTTSSIPLLVGFAAAVAVCGGAALLLRQVVKKRREAQAE